MMALAGDNRSSTTARLRDCGERLAGFPAPETATCPADGRGIGRRSVLPINGEGTADRRNGLPCAPRNLPLRSRCPGNSAEKVCGTYYRGDHRGTYFQRRSLISVISFGEGRNFAIFRQPRSPAIRTKPAILDLGGSGSAVGTPRDRCSFEMFMKSRSG